MESILRKLKVDCPFPEVFEDVEKGSSAYAPVYRRKLGHLCADYDGYRWWSTWWPCHTELITKERTMEIDSVYDALIDKKGFPGLAALRQFCKAHPEAVAGDPEDGEYNFYYEGALCNYWVRLIIRSRDYNMYLHTFVKEAVQC